MQAICVHESVLTAVPIQLPPYSHCLSDSALLVACRIHKLNVDALMMCALPYHATNEFVRLVQLLRLTNTKWHWLSNMQESGASMPRSILVQRCVKDQAVLRFICESAQAFGNHNSVSKTFLSFYAVTLCEVIIGKNEVRLMWITTWSHTILVAVWLHPSLPRPFISNEC